MAKLSDEFKNAVKEEAERQGRTGVRSRDVISLLDMLTEDVCNEYLKNVNYNLSQKLKEIEDTERKVDEKIKLLNEKIAELEVKTDKYETTKKEALAMSQCLPKDMLAIVNMFSAMVDSATNRGADSDLAVSKVAYMLNAYLGSESLPSEEDCAEIGEYQGDGGDTKSIVKKNGQKQKYYDGYCKDRPWS